ncbi:MAG: DUF5808 domain-containing protein [Acidimicrobiales bacterium]
MADSDVDGKDEESAGNGDEAVPDPQGHFAGVPYDFRGLTAKKVKARMWNSQDSRLFTPKAFGWGYDINLYTLTHPNRWLSGGKSK